ncbi:hypothetical protein GCM10020331_070160 [Ectobacillus funiculus]
MIGTDLYVEQIEKDAVRFTDESHLKPLIQTASSAKYVLLGEASHGTSEFLYGSIRYYKAAY